MNITGGERLLIEEIIGGRYDSLKEMVTQFPNMDEDNKKKLLKDIEKLEPLVKKLRNQHDE